MTKILNTSNIPKEFIGEFLGKASTYYLGKAAGSEKIYVNIDKIQPGAKSAKYHSHSKQEEFFLILSGTGTLRMNGEEYQVGKGDFVAKPAGRNIAHQFINSGNAVLEILDVGTKEAGEIAFYPDEEVYYLVDQDMVFKKSDKLDDWDSEPNK